MRKGRALKKSVIFPALAVLSAVAFSLFAAWAGVSVYLKRAEISGRPAPLAYKVRKFKPTRDLFIKEEFKRLLRAVSENEKEKFSTTWDTNNEIALSKKLFVDQMMFGVPKYRYRPGIGIYNVRVWSGLSYRKLAIAATPEITALLGKNKVIERVYFETDKNGFKTAGAVPGPSLPVVFFMGDSFTEGLWVSPEETFVELFGRKLKVEGIRARPVNTGVNGYGVLEMAWMLERHAPRFKTAAVILNLFPNDVQHDYIKALTGDVPEAGYVEMFKYLRRIVEYCRKHDIMLAVSVIPAKAQFGTFRGHSDFQDRVGAWAKPRGTRFLDARGHFDEVGADKVYFPWDPHFSPEGHAHYADFLFKNLAAPIRKKLSGHSG